MTWLSQIFGIFKQFQLWFVIAPWESALRVRLGKNAVTLGPGPHWRIPFVDRVFVQATRLRTITDSGQTMSTKDGKAVTIATAISYSIDDIATMYRSVSNPETTLLGTVQGIVADAISSRTAEELGPSIIERAVLEHMPKREWGLGNVSVKVTTYAIVRTFRFLNYEYRSLSAVDNLETKL